MAESGRKKAPLRLVTASGRPDPKTRGKKTRTRAPRAPSHLPALARKAWTRAKKVVEEMGLPVESDLLEGVAMLLYRAKTADAYLVEHGAWSDDGGGDKRHPAAVESLQCWREWRIMCNEIGLTPSARAKLLGDREPKPDNPFAKMRKA